MKEKMQERHLVTVGGNVGRVGLQPISSVIVPRITMARRENCANASDEAVSVSDVGSLFDRAIGKRPKL